MPSTLDKGDQKVRVLYSSVSCFMLLAAFYNELALAETARIDRKSHDHVVVKLDAKYLFDYGQSSVNQYQMFSVVDNALEPVPFQIDEYNQDGFVYFEEMSFHSEGIVGVLDGFDKLLFMYSDAGTDQFGADRLSHLVDSAEILAVDEIEITFSDSKRYVYLVRFDNKGVDADYSNHLGYIKSSPSHGEYKTDYFTLQFNAEDPLAWQNFYYHSFSGEKTKPLFDGLKIRLVGSVGSQLTRLTLNNRNIKANIIGARDGAIRSTLQLEADLSFMKFALMKVYLQAQIYRDAIIVYTWFDKRPKISNVLFRNPVVYVTLDGNNLLGSTVETTQYPYGQGVMVDGQMSEREFGFVKAHDSMSNPWLRFKTDNNFNVTARFIAPQKFEVGLGLVYEDDAKRKNKPERFLGQLPNVGYKVSDITRYDNFEMGFSIYFGNNDSGVSLHDHSEVLETPLNLKIARLLVGDENGVTGLRALEPKTSSKYLREIHISTADASYAR